MFDNYLPSPGVFDELMAGPGNIRPQWKLFRAAVESIGRTEMSRRWTHIQRLVHKNGIAYSGYTDPHGQPRPWKLDALPMLIAGAEWRVISAGLQQRAQLLDLILKDLYGSQELLKPNLIPPEILYLHPGFWRPCHGVSTPNDRQLLNYAADLARSPDGRWWVLADRTEAPSGAGFALENRIVMSRMLPDIFHRNHVERLAPYFLALRETLHSLAPSSQENPRIVLLSAGQKNANYFEDAYLARYLNFTLVEPDDLAVRNNQVMLKTLGGLMPVQVLMRRPNSEDCDPLELSPQSPQGVTGLLQSIRDGKVTVCNPLGSGLVESPVFMAFLPQLCQHLLGEDLMLPGVATWWCGRQAGLDYVIKNIDALVIKRAFRQRGQDLHFNHQLNSIPREERIKAIQANPKMFVGQEKVNRSSTPAWSNGQLKPSRVTLRSFLVASEDSYTVMQGGLARVAIGSANNSSILSGETSKDVWVVSESEVNQISLLPTTNRQLPLKRGGAELPSRVADNLFWLGRQLERADAGARLIRAVTVRLTGEADAQEVVELPVLIRAMAGMGGIEPGFAVEEMRGLLPSLEAFLPQTIFDMDQPGSLRSVITQMLGSGSRVRDRLSVDSWGILNGMYQHFQPSEDGVTDLADVLSLVNDVIMDLAAFAGMAGESMTRTQSWRFLDLGRRLERAMQLIGLLKSTIADPANVHTPMLEAVLEVADSSMTYRNRYLADVQFNAVLDLLVTDEINPRSVAYQLVCLAEHVDQLPRDRSQPLYNSEQRLAMTCLHAVRLINVNDLAELHILGDEDPLDELLSDLESWLPKLAESISHKYLIHAGTAQQLAEIRPE